MSICKDATCSRSYLSQEGKTLVDMVRVLRAAHNENRTPQPVAIQRIKELAARIYQAGPFCAGCEGQNMAANTGLNEPEEVNVLLENIEVLQMYGALP